MEDKIKFRCTACNWGFARYEQPNLCPYCGKMSVILDTSKGAQDIIEEIEDAEQAFQSRQ